MNRCGICHEHFKIGDRHTSYQVGAEVHVGHTDCVEARENYHQQGQYQVVEGHLILEVEPLSEWWNRVVKQDYDDAVPKAEEYGGTHSGSADLMIMGYALKHLRIPEDAPDEIGQIAACWLYELGKVARGITNLNKGEPIKQDHMHDGRVYWMMMQRLAETGRWP